MRCTYNELGSLVSEDDRVARLGKTYDWNIFMNTSDVFNLPQADFEGGRWYVLPLVNWNMLPEMQIAKLD